MILFAAILVTVSAALTVVVLGCIGLYRYLTGRAAGKLARAAAFSGGALVTAGVLFALNEITAPMGYGIAPRDRTARAFVEMYRPGLFLLLGVSFGALGWGIRRLGVWAERRLGEVVRRHTLEAAPADGVGEHPG